MLSLKDKKGGGIAKLFSVDKFQDRSTSFCSHYNQFFVVYSFSTVITTETSVSPSQLNVWGRENVVL